MTNQLLLPLAVTVSYGLPAAQATSLHVASKNTKKKQLQVPPFHLHSSRWQEEFTARFRQCAGKRRVARAVRYRPSINANDTGVTVVFWWSIGQPVKDSLLPNVIPWILHDTARQNTC